MRSGMPGSASREPNDRIPTAYELARGEVDGCILQAICIVTSELARIWTPIRAEAPPLRARGRLVRTRTRGLD